MFDYGKKLGSEINKNGAKTLLYLTWALPDKPDDQPAISKAYLDLSKELKAPVRSNSRPSDQESDNQGGAK
jgi:hypothetical protein